MYTLSEYAVSGSAACSSYRTESLMRAGLLLALCLISGQLSSALATVSKQPHRETCDWESNVTKQPPTEVGQGTA